MTYTQQKIKKQSLQFTTNTIIFVYYVRYCLIFDKILIVLK